MVYQPITIFCDLCNKELSKEDLESWNEDTDFLNKKFPNQNVGLSCFSFGSNNQEVRNFIDGSNKRNLNPTGNLSPVKWENNFFREYCFKCVIKEFHGIPFNHEPHREKGNVYYFHLCNKCFENERFRLLFPHQYNRLNDLEKKFERYERLVDQLFNNSKK